MLHTPPIIIQYLSTQANRFPESKEKLARKDPQELLDQQDPRVLQDNKENAGRQENLFLDRLVLVAQQAQLALMANPEFKEMSDQRDQLEPLVSNA